MKVQKWKAISILAAGILPILFLMSCTGPEDHAADKEPIDSEHAAASFWDAGPIKITDIMPDRYLDPLNIELSDEEVSAFHLAAEKQAGISDDASDAEAGQQLNLMGNYYSIHLFGDGGKEKNVLTVDLTHTVCDSNGNAVPSKPYIEQWLSEIEASHGITYASVLNRAPGAGYFALLADADHAVLEEMPDKDRTDLVHREYTRTQTSVLADSLKDMLGDSSELAKKQETPDVRWKLTLFKEEMFLYEFERDPDGHVFSNGFRINSREIESLFTSLLSI